MSHHTKEDCLRQGIPLRAVKRRHTRRSRWHDYYVPGKYGVTFHLAQDEEGAYPDGTLLGVIHKDGIALSETGRLAEAKIEEIGHWENPRLMELYGAIRIVNYACMPTHIHMTLEITQTLPKVMKRGKLTQITLSDFVRGLKQGISSWYWRRKEGESVEEIMARPYVGGARSMVNEGNEADKHPSIWEENYSDNILNSYRKLTAWIKYVDLNAYFWWMETQYPNLFERRLHLDIVMKDGEHTDFSAYGCIFLLRKGVRVQVMCHRLARRKHLTTDEWQRWTASWQTIKELQDGVVRQKLGRYDRDWYRDDSPETICPIPYTQTEAFRRQKAAMLEEARQGAVLLSPTISKGEQEIVMAALAEGWPVIKLRKEPFTTRSHPSDADRAYCAEGQMLVLAPWEIGPRSIMSEHMAKGEYMAKGEQTAMSESLKGSMGGRPVDQSSDYAKFHNLNALAARMCEDIERLALRQEKE